MRLQQTISKELPLVNYKRQFET